MVQQHILLNFNVTKRSAIIFSTIGPVATTRNVWSNFSIFRERDRILPAIVFALE